MPAHAAEKLRIGTEGAYPPFNFVDTAGKIGGFDVDIGLALCAKMQVECEVVAQDWDGIIPGLVARKYDMIIASMFITDERRKQVAFSDPYYLAAMTHVAAKGAGIAAFTNEALKGKVIGAQAGTTQAELSPLSIRMRISSSTRPRTKPILTWPMAAPTWKSATCCQCSTGSTRTMTANAAS